MTYSEAIKYKESKMNLIGTKDSKGFNIDEILVVPSNETERNKFFESYLSTQDAEKAISKIKDTSFDVWTIDKKHLQQANILFYNKLND